MRKIKKQLYYNLEIETRIEISVIRRQTVFLNFEIFNDMVDALIHFDMFGDASHVTDLFLTFCEIHFDPLGKCSSKISSRA